MSAEATRRLGPMICIAISLAAYPGDSSTILVAHRIKVKRAVFNEIATPGDGAHDGRLLLRTDQTNGWAAPMSWKAPDAVLHVSVVVAALLPHRL